MNIFKLVYRYLTDKILNTILNVFLLSLGIAVICVLINFSRQVTEKLESNIRSIDLVVGAKGSPLQLILCSIFHSDFPTGNIKLQEAEKIAHHRFVKNAIPLSMGDSYEGYRIIGTTTVYPKLYEAQLENGNWFTDPMDAVIGSSVANRSELRIGDLFSSSHGLSGDGEEHHHRFKVVGVMKSTGSVVDNLILTPIESIWEVHEEHEEEHHQSDSLKEITALLIQFRNPIAAVQLPRYINSNTNMQAASPAFETARLFSILGVGADVISGFAAVLIVISVLSIFIALYNSMTQRRYDLVIMRAMGAGRRFLAISLLLEGIAITMMGTILGLLLGHLSIFVFTITMIDNSQIGLNAFSLVDEEILLIISSVILGALASLTPAVQAFRLNIHKVLAHA